MFAYGSDRETAMASRDGLEKLMLELAHEPDVGRVHILAHSMGAWLAMEALRENAIAGHPDLDGHLGEVMLAAPDIDAAVFAQQMARLGSGAHVTILVAHNDRALGLSSLLANDRPRVGSIDPLGSGGTVDHRAARRQRHRPLRRARRVHRAQHLCQRP